MTLNLNSIIAIARLENTASRKVIEKLGMNYIDHIDYKAQILVLYQIEKKQFIYKSPVDMTYQYTKSDITFINNRVQK